MLGDLPVINLPLHGTITDQPVDIAWFGLTIAVDSADSLGVVARIPRDVGYNDTIGSDEIDAKTTSSECVRGGKEGGLRWCT